MKPAMQWAVQRGDGRSVRDIVARMQALGAPAAARVFLNGRRAELDEPVEQGDLVELWPRRAAPGEDEVRIVTQRDGLLVAYKPAGLPTDTTQLGEDSLTSALLSQLSGGKIHAASRLDVAVSGLVLCTLGPDAARRLRRLREAGQFRRRYLGIAHGALPDDEGRWEAPLGSLRDRAGRHRASPHAAERKPARTRFRVAARTQEDLLLELEPETGRMHQLRAHAALAGVPLWGDRAYGGPLRVADASGQVYALGRILLHAWQVELPGLRAEAPPPEEMMMLWRRLGGDDADWPPQSEAPISNR